MTTANNTFDYESFAGSAYLGNVFSAIGNLLSALFSGKPAVASAPKADTSVSNSYLARMADDYEHIAPNLSAELRFMASRG